MNKLKEINNSYGMSLVELVITMTVITLLLGIGIPGYGRYIANNRVRSAAGDLVANMRLARMMAIGENRNYLITFNDIEDNSYSMGFDGDGDNSLDDAADGYGDGDVRTVSLPESYGGDILYGTVAKEGPGERSDCSACIGIIGSTAAFGGTADPVRQEFNPDGTTSFTGSVFFMHASRGTTFMLRVSNQAGKVDLWKWDGDNSMKDPTKTEQCDNSPIRCCGWVELR